jgi:hypothetical protein
MAKQKKKKTITTVFGTKKVCTHKNQSDAAYFLKLIVYFICGTFWVRLLNVEIGPFEHLSLPLGLIVGVAFSTYECSHVDKKIELAVLLAATFISFYLPVGITI